MLCGHLRQTCVNIHEGSVIYVLCNLDYNLEVPKN